MPRRPRIDLPGTPLHIVQRGHNRDACFFSEGDYHAYRHWLGEALTATGATAGGRESLSRQRET